MFLANGYSIFISEGALANQAVIAATALDVDAGNNSKLNYKITDGNDGSRWLIVIPFT